MNEEIETAYLQHSPFRAESVFAKNEYGDRWLALYEGRWRRVHIQVKRTFIVYRGTQIEIDMKGLI